MEQLNPLPSNISYGVDYHQGIIGDMLSGLAEEELPKDQTHFNVEDAQKILDSAAARAEIDPLMEIPDVVKPSGQIATGSDVSSGTFHEPEEGFFDDQFYSREYHSHSEGIPSGITESAQEISSAHSERSTPPTSKEPFSPFKDSPAPAGQTGVKSIEEAVGETSRKSKSFDHKIQIEVIDKVFTEFGISCHPIMKNKIISRGITEERVITPEEISWYCAGVREERAFGASAKLEGMISQMIGEVSKMQATEKQLVEIELKLRENISEMNKMRYQGTSPPAESEL